MYPQSEVKIYVGSIVTIFRDEFCNEKNQKVELKKLNMWKEEIWNKYRKGILVHEENGIKYKLCHKKGGNSELTNQEKKDGIQKITPIDGSGRPAMILDYDSISKKYLIITSTSNIDRREQLNEDFPAFVIKGKKTGKNCYNFYWENQTKINENFILELNKEIKINQKEINRWCKDLLNKNRSTQRQIIKIALKLEEISYDDFEKIQKSNEEKIEKLEKEIEILKRNQNIFHNINQSQIALELAKKIIELMEEKQQLVKENIFKNIDDMITMIFRKKRFTNIENYGRVYANSAKNEDDFGRPFRSDYIAQSKTTEVLATDGDPGRKSQYIAQSKTTEVPIKVGPDAIKKAIEAAGIERQCRVPQIGPSGANINIKNENKEKIRFAYRNCSNYEETCANSAKNKYFEETSKQYENTEEIDFLYPNFDWSNYEITYIKNKSEENKEKPNKKSQEKEKYEDFDKDDKPNYSKTLFGLKGYFQKSSNKINEQQAKKMEAVAKGSKIVSSQIECGCKRYQETENQKYDDFDKDDKFKLSEKNFAGFKKGFLNINNNSTFNNGGVKDSSGKYHRKKDSDIITSEQELLEKKYQEILKQLEQLEIAKQREFQKLELIQSNRWLDIKKEVNEKEKLKDDFSLLDVPTHELEKKLQNKKKNYQSQN